MSVLSDPGSWILPNIVVPLARRFTPVLTLLALLGGTPASLAQNAPVVVSVTPENGATSVPTTSPLVFVFDQAMDTAVPVIQSTAGLVGSFSIEAPGFNQILSATWGSDEKTLTISPTIQWPYATLTWTLNPAGALDFFKLRSKGGVQLAQISGGFTTGVGGTDPRLGSSRPMNGATGVGVGTIVEFRFDQAMKTNISISGNPAPVVWQGTAIDPTQFVYSWSADSRILYCDYSDGLPANTRITWALNPDGAAVRLEGQNGKFLASDTYSGHFTTASIYAGCEITGIPDSWGTYGISKNGNFRQTSSADPVPVTDTQVTFVFSALVRPSTVGGPVTAASITRPGGRQDDLESLVGTWQLLDTPPTQAALDEAAPAGDYALRFTVTGQAERTITMSMPPNPPPIPKITNFDEAQAINAGADFTLRWNGFTGASAQDHISMYISDSNGQIVFQAPNLCVPVELPVTATSIVIPAGTLRTNETFSAALLYGRFFYNSTNAVPLMFGYGDIIRNTYFTVKTGNGGSSGGSPATLANYRVLATGHPEFQISGTASRQYTIQRTSSLANTVWQEVGAVTMDSTGKAVFEDADEGAPFPLFYRALTE